MMKTAPAKQKKTNPVKNKKTAAGQHKPVAAKKKNNLAASNNKPPKQVSKAIANKRNNVSGPKQNGSRTARSSKKENLNFAMQSLANNEERYHRMINEVVDYAIFLLSPSGVIQNWNLGAEKIKGYTPKEVIGKKFHLFYSKQDQENKLPEKLLKQAAKEGKATHEGWRVRKDGSKFWGNMVITAIHDDRNKIIGFSKVTRDLTERKNAEDLIRTTNEELKKKNEALEKANKELEAFAYFSSHDLQEPLRKIQTFSGRIMDKEKHNLSDTAKNYFQYIQNSAKRMQVLIQDILTFTRLNSTEKKYQEIKIENLVEEAKSEFREVLLEKHAVIEVKESCTFRAIPFQFRQLFYNLISNSLKFSDPARPPRIVITSTFEEGNATGQPYCHIRLSDNGIGFEKEYSSKIFEVFQRLHSKEDYPGTGIGLAIVKKVVENHNGKITASGELNKGATFDIYIPTHEK